MLQHAEKTLSQSENAGEKMLECAVELQAVNDAIIDEIGGRAFLKHLSRPSLTTCCFFWSSNMIFLRVKDY